MTDNDVRRYVKDWPTICRGEVVSMSRLEDGTLTLEIALDDVTHTIPLSTRVEVHRV